MKNDMFTAAAIGERLRTQDNRITYNPIFAVQELKREYGYDPCWRDNITWIDDDGDEADAKKAKSLERKFQSEGVEPSGWRRTAYVDRWEFVSAFFTEAAAKLFIEENGHNFGKLGKRIYVYGGYRNHEWEAVREMLSEERLTVTNTVESV